MSKRMQHVTGEERIVAESTPTMSRMENGMMSLNTCSSTSVKADIRYSAEEVLWNEDRCEAKEVENLSIHFCGDSLAV